MVISLDFKFLGLIAIQTYLTDWDKNLKFLDFKFTYPITRRRLNKQFLEWDVRDYAYGYKWFQFLFLIIRKTCFKVKMSSITLACRRPIVIWLWQRTKPSGACKVWIQSGKRQSKSSHGGLSCC